MSPVVISMMAFLAVSGLIGFLAFMMRDTTPRASTRLDLIIGKGKKGDDQVDILKKSARENDKQTLLGLLTPNFLSPKKWFEQADCNIQPSTIFGIGLLLASAAATLVVLTNRPIWFAPILGLIMFSVPFIWVWNKRRTRLNKFAKQLPDALELVARALRAGHSLAAGLQVVAQEMPSPICDEFGRVYEEQNLGVTMEEALDGMCERVPNLDLRFFVTSVGIQRQTGGDLAEILDKIGYVIRERYRILGQVQALTGEGRLSGVVLIALPFGLFAFMLQIKPDYVSALWTHPLGIKMSIFAIIAQILGAIVIKKIVDIKV